MNKKFRWHTVLHFCIIALITVGTLSCSHSGNKQDEDQRPNILLIVADDLGYADIDCYGGDIATPVIDDLANSGIKFSRFHTAPMCAPTRAMLLSGNDNHIAGMGGQGLVTEEFGYEGRLTNRIITIPELLGEAGYYTCMAGKWHLGLDSISNPHEKGFDHSFALLEGAGNHYNNRSVLRAGNSSYTEDGVSVAWKEGNYSTDYYTDKIIDYIDLNREKKQPFFAFAAYTSPHWPLQVDKKHWEKYKGRYDEGYEKLKLRRLESLKRIGMISADAGLPPNHESVSPWDSLSEEEKLMEARKMELYAGMVDNLDYNIGRLITYLKDIGEYENTLIVFMSDNGAAYRDFINSDNHAVLREYYNDDYENMGRADSYISYGPQWAETGTSPFRFFKDYATQGGINTPMIICGPHVTKRSETYHGFTSVQDLAPTFYEVAGIAYPEIFEEREVYPLKGTSLLPYVSGKSSEVHSDEYVFAMEHYGHAMLRKGKWKITNFIRPFELENFMLYDLSTDIGEQTDLREAEPDKYDEMLREWAVFSDKIQLQIPPPTPLSE
ncbi:MAG: arylsulfatase [Bacteroidales bacterium]|nr:arylsulfatase [Bacteroidales bacterium]